MVEPASIEHLAPSRMDTLWFSINVALMPPKMPPQCSFKRFAEHLAPSTGEVQLAGTR